MADETISTRIVANADFSALIADVHKVTASLSKLQEQLANSNKMMANQIAVMNRSFADTLRSTGQFSTHFVSLQSDVEKFGKNLDGGKLKLNQYFNTFRDHARTSGGLIRELAKQQVALQNSVLQPLGRNAQGLMQFNVHVPRGLDEVKNKSAILRQEMQILNKVIQDGATGLINWGKNTQWAGRQLTVGLTVPLVAFGAQAAKAFREADQELVRLTKVYGDVAGTSAAELGRVRNEVSATAKEISAAMGVSFKETIGLAADIAATGKTGDELLGSIKETTRLAVLGEVDRQEAMKATLAIQSAFKQNTDELSESINFLNAVENQTSTTLNDLVEAIPKAGPVIQGLGGSVQDLALYLTAMREGGINASEGANALKSALASLINPTDVAVGKFQSLGIDLLGIVNNNAGNLTGTLMALQGALDNLDPLQKQQAIEQLFGKFQFSRLNALFENLGRQGSQTLQVLDLMKASTGELASVADRELAAVTESASGKYRRAIESLRASLAEVGEQFLTINTVLIQVIDKVVQFANNLPGPVKQVLALAGGFTAIIGPVIMLTGVLANFFGYLLKGAFAMKSFLKGGEGWKYLTPEMLAAEKAGRLVEQSFYSDAKAAAVLQQALRNLLDEFALLEAKAKSGAMAVNPAVSTMAGSMIVGGQRIVNPQHPLAGQEGTRASSHMVPRSGMSEAQRLQQTMFGMVPGSIPVNQKIGQNPQIYMNEPLPNVPGLTTINGVSTGIVSGEASRWHAMMATLSMQSKAEIETLKKTIAATGTVSKEFMMQFDDILPVVSRLTDNAARESAMIVAELRAGKLTVEAARAKIVALNLQTEQMIASSVSASAVSMGRTINPTMVPTLNQPVVDPTGKSNMRELFKKGKTRDFINRIAGVLGVRTSGAGYNIETTVPKKFATGGTVVPGPRSDTTDTQYMNLNAGDFVLNRKASDALLGFNRGGQVPAMVTPGEIVVHDPSRDEIDMLSAYNNQFAVGGIVRPNKINYGTMTPANALSMFRGAASFFGNPNYTNNMKIGTIASDAAILHGMGMDPQAAIQMASADYDDAIRYATGKDGTFSLSRFTQRRNQLLRQVQQYGSLMGISGNPISQFTPGGKGAKRAAGFGRFDSGIKTIYSLLMGSNKFDPESKKYLKGLGLLNPTGIRSTARAHFQRFQTQDVQGQEYLYQASPIPAPVNSFLATSESKRLGKDLLPPVAEGRGGAKGFFQRILQNAASRGGYNRAQVPAASDVLAPSKKATPLQRMLQAALSSALTRRPIPVMRNSGGMIPGYNMGGLVPSANGQKYNRGGRVPGVQYMQRGGFLKGMLGGAAIGMGGQMLGNSIGGGLGTAISYGSSILGSMIGFGGIGSRGDEKGSGFIGKQMQKLDPNLTKPIGPLNSLSTASKGLAGNLGGIAKIFGPVLRGFSTLLKLTSPLGIAITGVTAAIGFFVKAQKEKAAALEIGRQAFGMDAEAAKKAGFTYTDYNAKIKEAISNAQALKERNVMIYESMTKANVPINLTIEQYKKLKEQVKETMGSYIQLFDQTNRKDVGNVAVQLKAQFMAAGDTAEVATAKIFTMIKESKNASAAAQAISASAFQSIQNIEQASAQTVKTYEAATKTGDAESQAKALHTVFMAMDASIASVVEEQKKLGGTGEEAAERVAGAIKSKVAEINRLFGTQATLTEDVISEIGKANPLLAEMLNDTDTLNSAWAKYRLTLSGVTMNFQFMSGEAAIAANELNEIVKAQVQLNPAVKSANAEYGKMTARIKDLEKAQKGQSVKAQYNAKEESKRLQEQIADIKKAAQEKIEGIRKATEAENTQLEIQKAQLRAQQALIQGNMTAYAEEQMTIEQLMNEANRKDAEEAIIAKAEIDIKPLQDALDAIANKQEAVAKKAALAGDSLAAMRTKADDYNSNLTQYTTNLTNLMTKLQIEGDKFKLTKEFTTTMTALETLGKNLGIKTTPQQVLDQIGAALSKNQIVANQVNILTGKIRDGSITGAGTFSSPYSLGQQGIGTKGEIQGASLKNYGNVLKDFGETGIGQKLKNFAYKQGLVMGDYFSAEDDKGLVSVFKVTDEDGNIKRVKNPYEKKSLGGQFAAGDNLLINDRKNALGTQIEGIAISPNFSGTVYPNAATMPTYNIPTGQKGYGVNISNSPSSNNVYDINIVLNGTNVTAEDVIIQMKREMALVNAKEGINRRV